MYLEASTHYLWLFFGFYVLISEQHHVSFLGEVLNSWNATFGAVKGLGENESKDVLRGTTLEVYRFLLRQNKPVGTRELQRALNLSSSSVATYHLTKLEDAGLLKREAGGFSVAKYLLENSIKISRFLIPRYFFYVVFAVAALILELMVFRPAVLYQEYAFSVAVTAILVVFLIYETAKTWKKGNL
jgi:hypothetical protein